MTRLHPYVVKAMTAAEVGTAINWAAAEGWNPGLHDADCFLAADAGGFLMGFLDEEPVASISVVRYGRSFAFLGLYIVKPEHRGKGYGRALLVDLAKIARDRGCGRMEWAVLDWNDPAIQFYRRMGAKPMDEWTVFRLTDDGIATLASS